MSLSSFKDKVTNKIFACKWIFEIIFIFRAKSSEAAEYTDCISVDG